MEPLPRNTKAKSPSELWADYERLCRRTMWLAFAAGAISATLVCLAVLIFLAVAS